MRRRFRRKPKKKPQIPQMRANERIFADPIILIDHNGEHVGEIALSEARTMAESVGLDLVEVSPKAHPPVCKILDYGKFQYAQAKQYKQSKSQQKVVSTKGVRIGLRTDTHDLDFKKRQAEKFLSKGNKVKVEIVLRGREKAHQDLAKENIQNFLNALEVPFRTEEQIKKFPGGFNTIIAPE
ncbi:MAG: translation initiation factor IF-3 [Candidatus Moraniibacteriota bacterium]|nr:MAG: translation initiation factor IF-3 [Candidatus Moranbacteria bacterium]